MCVSPFDGALVTNEMNGIHILTRKVCFCFALLRVSEAIVPERTQLSDATAVGTRSDIYRRRYGVPDEGMVGRCKLDPGLKAPPGFKSSNLMKINFTFNLRNLILSLSSRRRYGLGH